MGRFAYLAYLAISFGSMLAICAWLGTLDRRMLRALLVTVPIFFVLDLVGVARGWFYTDPSLNVWILPGGVSIEEVINLGFLTLFSVALAADLRRWRHE
jgi:hypothetical protein